MKELFHEISNKYNKQARSGPARAGERKKEENIEERNIEGKERKDRDIWLRKAKIMIKTQFLGKISRSTTMAEVGDRKSRSNPIKPKLSVCT